MKEIIKFYGKEHQCRIAMEECAELIQAINKCLRYPDDKLHRDNLIEEMADVNIMLNQLETMFDIQSEEIYGMLLVKSSRLRKQYEKDKEEREQND